MLNILNKKNMKNKKGQIQTFETVGVLVIFFFLIIVGFTVYVKLQSENFIKTKERQGELMAFQIQQKAAFMPEFQCSQRNIHQDNCFDSLKVELMNQSWSDSIMRQELIFRYYDLFRHSTIELYDIFPNGTRTCSDGCLIYNSTLNNSATQVGIMPVSIWDPIKNIYSIGMLHVIVYVGR
jgi:hypothetical protein